jgi:hypothetical protein
MVTQLRLIFYFLQRQQRNLPLVSHRQSKFSLSVFSFFSFRPLGSLGFFGGYFSPSFFVLRASPLKKYKYGFDMGLLTLKDGFSSRGVLRGSLGVVPGRPGVVLPLGAWGKKFKASSLVRSGFFLPKKKKTPSLFGSASLGFWFFFLPVNFFLLSSALPHVSFFRHIVSPRYPGLFFFSQLAGFLSLREGGEGLDFFLALQLLSPSIFTRGCSSIFSLSADDLNYSLLIKNNILTSFAEFVIFCRLFDLTLPVFFLKKKGGGV